MKVKAALALEAAKPLVIEELDLEGPKPGEVLVRLAATGVCHTDAYTLSGRDPEGLFPAVMGLRETCTATFAGLTSVGHERVNLRSTSSSCPARPFLCTVSIPSEVVDECRSTTEVGVPSDCRCTEKRPAAPVYDAGDSSAEGKIEAN